MIIFTIAIVIIVLGTAFLSYLATKSLLERETTLLRQKIDRLEERHLYLEMEHGNLEAYTKHLKDENLLMVDQLNQIKSDVIENNTDNNTQTEE